MRPRPSFNADEWSLFTEVNVVIPPKNVVLGRINAMLWRSTSAYGQSSFNMKQL